jgi:hypothetical protein
MTKHIRLRIERITKCKDKKYVDDVIDSIIDSLHDFPNTVEKIGLCRNKDMFIVKFDLKVSKLGDLVWMLVKEFMSTIYETEPLIELSISETEDKAQTGITYKFFTYKPHEETEI